MDYFLPVRNLYERLYPEAKCDTTLHKITVSDSGEEYKKFLEWFSFCVNDYNCWCLKFEGKLFWNALLYPTSDGLLSRKLAGTNPRKFIFDEIILNRSEITIYITKYAGNTRPATAIHIFYVPLYKHFNVVSCDANETLWWNPQWNL